MSASPGARHVRQEVRVRGRVQGVGFRPTVYRIASELALAGFVRNDGQGVLIEIEGDADDVARFLTTLPCALPDLAHIESLEETPLPPVGERGFRIATSDGADEAELPAASIPADLAPCERCLSELRDPRDRRYRYPFINCTACGPRFTIVRSIPYDRSRTTMAPFDLCAECRREYEDPADRRFHAEPNACPACGPALVLLTPGRPALRAEAALAEAARTLAAGLVLAVKGAGGFLLATDATRADAVARLRSRKRRPDKPFAVMAGDLAALEEIVDLDDRTRRVLASPARPIVLLPARAGGPIDAGVAPRLGELGVFLPATPLQHLLLADGPRFLVMTSGNASDEPIARTDEEALDRLGPIADAFLVHDREIHTRADDSVVRPLGGGVLTVRRARGLVPEPFTLPVAGPPVLAVGGELKNTLCLTRGREAILSQHVGDLEALETRAFFAETERKLAALAGVEPVAIAHDLHPDFHSTRWARAAGLPLEPVQHHHAHVASCLVEHGRTGPVLGVVLDGTGLGPDGGLWGGELLLADLGGFRRLAHLRALPLAGGELAIRQPWRLAAAALADAHESLDPLRARFAARGLDALASALGEPARAPLATGAGRWFDAVGVLCGLTGDISYDGQVAIELEALAAPGEHGEYPFSPAERHTGLMEADLRPTIQAIAADLRRGVPASIIAARFHRTLAGVVAVWCACAVAAGGPRTVALSGGCFQNRRLTELVATELARLDVEVLLHRRVPCNDGGLALGQAAVAAFRLARKDGAPCA